MLNGRFAASELSGTDRTQNEITRNKIDVPRVFITTFVSCIPVVCPPWKEDEEWRRRDKEEERIDVSMINFYFM